jgi:hypothetical protein
MVYLVTDGLAAGIAQTREIRTPYATLDEAQAQADHDLAYGRTPLRIVDADTEAVLWEPPPVA